MGMFLILTGLVLTAAIIGVFWLNANQKAEVTRLQEGQQKPDDTSEQTILPKTEAKPADGISLLERDYKFIAVDVETANKNRHSICQIGLALVEHDHTIHTVSHLINPNEAFDDFNIGLHGINEDMVEDEPKLPAFMEVSRRLLERHTLIQHSNFDEIAFRMACDLHGLPELKTNWVDSVQIASAAWPEFRDAGGHGLANLKKQLGLVFDHHDAEQDAYAAAQITLMAEDKLGKPFREIVTAKSTPQKKKSYPPKVTRTGEPDCAFSGKAVCFTGKTDTPRAELADMAAEAGMDVKSGVSKKTHFVVVAEDDFDIIDEEDMTAKHRRAVQLQEQGHDIEIIDEYDFIDMIEGRDTLSIDIDIAKIIERSIERS